MMNDEDEDEWSQLFAENDQRKAELQAIEEFIEAVGADEGPLAYGSVGGNRYWVPRLGTVCGPARDGNRRSMVTKYTALTMDPHSPYATASSPECDFKEKFMQFVEERGGCWIWQGEFSSTGEPLLSVRTGLSARAESRMLFMNFNNKEVRKGCGNKACVNPEHLPVKAAALSKNAILLKAHAAVIAEFEADYPAHIEVEEGGCWIWTGTVDTRSGWYKLKLPLWNYISATKLMFCLANDLDSWKYVFVATNCGDPRCVSPKHIVERKRNAKMDLIYKEWLAEQRRKYDAAVDEFKLLEERKIDITELRVLNQERAKEWVALSTEKRAAALEAKKERQMLLKLNYERRKRDARAHAMAHAEQLRLERSIARALRAGGEAREALLNKPWYEVTSLLEHGNELKRARRDPDFSEIGFRYCPNGHEMKGAVIYRAADGKYRCRRCLIDSLYIK